MPSLAVLVVVKVFAPLNQIVHLVIEVVVVDLLELLVIERVLVQRL